MALSEAYLPTVQASQLDEPLMGAAWPAPQATHVSEERARAVDDAVPAGQAMHLQFP